MTEIISRKEAHAADPEKFRERSRNWYAANRERALERKRKAREADPEKFRERSRKHRAKNLEKCRERSRKWNRKAFAADPERILKRQRKERAANPEKFKEQKRRRRAANPEKFKEQARNLRAANPEKVRERDRKRSHTPLRQLRKFASSAFQRMEVGPLDHSKLEYVDYTPEDFIAHLESTLPPGVTFREARIMGYHIDHIVPQAFLIAALPEYEEKRKWMVLDLGNLEMIPGVENMSKSAEVCMNEKQEKVFHYLCEKYDVTDAMLAEVFPY